MGDTLDAIKTAIGLRYQWVLNIEGLEYLITDGDTSAAVTAWAATEMTQALGGLQVSGEVEQRLDPWSANLEPSSLTFGILPDADDILGKLFFGSAAGTSTFLDTALDSNDTTVSVLRADDFGASGSIHIGCEHITYSSRDTGADTFTVAARGKYAPFKANTESAQRWGREHRIPDFAPGVVIKPRVTSKQRSWIGRWVGLWLHRKVGSSLDTRAEAQCVFAGRIANVRDDANGMTYLDCDDVKGAVRDTTLLRDQFTARVADGIYLKAGWRFSARDNKAGTVKDANDLRVIASGASGANQMNAGIYTLDEIANALNQWFASELSAGRLNLKWTYLPRITTTDGTRSLLQWGEGTGSGHNAVDLQGPRQVMEFLGWTDAANGAATTPGRLIYSWDDAATFEVVSPEEPYRIYIYDEGTGTTNLNLSDVQGTWWDNQPWFPADLGLPTSTSGSFAVLQLNGGPLGLFKQIDADSVFLFSTNRYLDGVAGSAWRDSVNLRRVRDSDTTDYRLRQVVILSGSFSSLLTRFLASTGTASYNHASYDLLPSQLGAAIPWELLGDTWVNTVVSTSEATAPLVVVIEKPTGLLDVMGTELLARMATIVWKSGGLRLATWGTPTATSALHALTEGNKAAPSGVRDVNRTVANDNDSFLRNTVKLLHDRVLSGGFLSSLTIVDPGSADDHGDRAVEIEMRNTFRGSGNDTIAELGETIASMLPLFSRPLRVLKRTVSLPFYEDVAPGDVCTISDNFARDPDTGARGLTNKPALVISHRVDWGGYEIDTGSVAPPSAEVELVILPLVNVTAYSPCAEVNAQATNGGYNSGTATLTFQSHAHSESSESVDVSHFSAGDKVRIIEIDPDDSASPLTWTRTIDSVSAGSNTATLTTGLSSPTWDSAKRYRMIPDAYGTVTTAQKAKAFQADDADGMIADTVGPYVWGADSPLTSTYSSESPGEQAALYSQAAYGDGVPLDVGYERDAARLVNNLVSYRTTPVLHSLQSGTAKSVAGSYVRSIVEILPVCLHPGDLFAGERNLYLRPWFRSATGASVTVTVSLCRHPPIGSSLTLTDEDEPEYVLVGPYESVTFTTTSTSYIAGTEQSVSFRNVGPDGVAYLVVEVTPNANYRGMARIFGGAYAA